jgi:hypothetical protein
MSLCIVKRRATLHFHSTIAEYLSSLLPLILIPVYETKMAEAESASSVTELNNAIMHTYSPLLDLVL